MTITLQEAYQRSDLLHRERVPELTQLAIRIAGRHWGEDLPIDRIEPELFEAWQDRMLLDGHQPRSIRRYSVAIVSVLRHAWKRGDLKQLPRFKQSALLQERERVSLAECHERVKQRRMQRAAASAAKP